MATNDLTVELADGVLSLTMNRPDSALCGGRTGLEIQLRQRVIRFLLQRTCQHLMRRG